MVSQGYGSFRTAWRKPRGIEAVSIIRKGRVLWVKVMQLVRPVHRQAVRRGRLVWSNFHRCCVRIGFSQ